MGDIQDNLQNNISEKSFEKPSVAPLVLGILGFTGILLAFLGYIFGIIGLVISIQDRKKPNSKYGTAGMILSIVALVLSVINSILGIIIFMSIF